MGNDLLAWRWRSSNAMTSKADIWVDSRTTVQAASASSASCHVLAQTHQWSPALSPGKSKSCRGVIRSLPRLFANSRNLSVMIAHTTWRPWSFSSVAHLPSRNQPVSGSQLHSSRAWLSTFRRVDLSVAALRLIRLSKFSPYFRSVKESHNPVGVHLTYLRHSLYIEWLTLQRFCF